MTTHNFSIEDLALSLIVRLDRRNIFPPSYNNPETFIPSSDNLTKLSFRRPKRCPNAFLLCRKNVHEESNRKGTSNMRVISKVTSILWKNASPEEKDVYKKLADHVYEIHYRRISSIYKKFTSSPSSSLKEGESPSYSPYSLPLRLSKVTATAIAPSTSTPLQSKHLEGTSVTPPCSSSPSPTPSPLLSSIYQTSAPTFNFDLMDNYFLSNHQSNNNACIDLNPYPEFHGQLIAPQNDQIYFYNNVFDTQSNFSMY